jgi:hypothetical protein
MLSFDERPLFDQSMRFAMLLQISQQVPSLFKYFFRLEVLKFKFKVSLFIEEGGVWFITSDELCSNLANEAIFTANCSHQKPAVHPVWKMFDGLIETNLK